jgi:isoleucyl-tRNA synthetase
VLLFADEAWKIAGAKAAMFNSKVTYVLGKLNSDYVILAEKRIGEFIARVGSGKAENFKTLLVLTGDSLSDLVIENPVNEL